MRGDRLNAQLTARIRDSVHTVTVHYPVVRPVMAGAPPAAAPLSSLTGPAETEAVFPITGTPSAPDVTVSCLWLDSYSSRTMTPDSIGHDRVGWRAGATALARVLVSDTALTSDPWADTIFTGAEVVEHRSHRYRVQAVEPVGASFSEPLTYHVWLTGALKQ